VNTAVWVHLRDSVGSTGLRVVHLDRRWLPVGEHRAGWRSGEGALVSTTRADGSVRPDRRTDEIHCPCWCGGGVVEQHGGRDESVSG
jgi:hypothetical protein